MELSSKLSYDEYLRLALHLDRLDGEFHRLMSELEETLIKLNE